MAYDPSATNVTQPTADKTLGSAPEEFREIKLELASVKASQVSKPSTSTVGLIPVWNGSTINWQAITVEGGVELDYYLPKDGSQPMSGKLQLSSNPADTPSAPVDAISLGFLQTFAADAAGRLGAFTELTGDVSTNLEVAQVLNKVIQIKSTTSTTTSLPLMPSSAVTKTCYVMNKSRVWQTLAFPGGSITTLSGYNVPSIRLEPGRYVFLVAVATDRFEIITGDYTLKRPNSAALADQMLLSSPHETHYYERVGGTVLDLGTQMEENAVYSVRVQTRDMTSQDSVVYLLPNSTEYPGQFIRSQIHLQVPGNNVVGVGAEQVAAGVAGSGGFLMDVSAGVSGRNPAGVFDIYNYRSSKRVHAAIGDSVSPYVYSGVWNNTTTQWSSVGRLSTNAAVSVSGVSGSDASATTEVWITRKA